MFYDKLISNSIPFARSVSLMRQEIQLPLAQPDLIHFIFLKKKINSHGIVWSASFGLSPTRLTFNGMGSSASSVLLLRTVQAAHFSSLRLLQKDHFSWHNLICFIWSSPQILTSNGIGSSASFDLLPQGLLPMAWASLLYLIFPHRFFPKKDYFK